jgi:hypothetical protein
LPWLHNTSATAPAVVWYNPVRETPNRTVSSTATGGMTAVAGRPFCAHTVPPLKLASDSQQPTRNANRPQLPRLPSKRKAHRLGKVLESPITLIDSAAFGQMASLPLPLGRKGSQLPCWLRTGLLLALDRPAHGLLPLRSLLGTSKRRQSSNLVGGTI